MNAAHRLTVFLAIVFACVIATIAAAPRPIPQDQSYHHFADRRTVLGIPNFADTASSIIFILAGVSGLVTLRRRSFEPLTVLCIGAVLTGIGSAVYHWKPSDTSLVFDRLGMVVAFAAFIAALMSHFDIAGSRSALPILIVAGIGSVLWWIYAGDLRPYGIFQGFPVILFVIGSFAFPHLYSRHSILWVITMGYLLAKVCEILDWKIYEFSGFVSGHTLKHLVAGVSLWMTIDWLKRQRQTKTAVLEPSDFKAAQPATTSRNTIASNDRPTNHASGSIVSGNAQS